MTFLPRMTMGVVLALGIAALFGTVRASELPAPPAGMGHARMCSDMDARMAGHQAYTEAKLNLTEAQKVEFKAVTEAMKTAREPMRKLCAEQAAQTATTMPARMAEMQKMMAAGSESMAKILPTMTKFYNSLTPEQQKIADTSLMPGGGHHGGMGHGPWAH